MYYLQKALSLPPHIAIRKALTLPIRLIQQKYLGQFHCWQDHQSPTYTISSITTTEPLHRYLPTVPQITSEQEIEQILALSDLYLAHRFDLLGSGWLQVRHGIKCPGLEGHCYETDLVTPDREGQWLKGRINAANLNYSQSIWRALDPDYLPIDWHLDFKSGYRWSEATWHLDVRYAHLPGVDIKVPWELARMQHLPILAWAYSLAIKPLAGFQPPEIYVREFRNQVLDFIATNPPRFGVNWRCTMDVGIRVVNWLVTYDLFKAMSVNFDPDFETIFRRSLYDHSYHILNHLEWGSELRSNHYLSNIAGLLFLAAYLPRTSATDQWLAFSIQELISEVRIQFNPDGSNFEASTSYHRLSAEIFGYCAALCLTLPPEKRDGLTTYRSNLRRSPPLLRPTDHQEYKVECDHLLPDWFWQRLEKAAEFTAHITKPNGEICQIGDNDSGRFLKLWPIVEKLEPSQAKAIYLNLPDPADCVYWDEEILKHHHLFQIIGVLFQRSDLLKQLSISPALLTPETLLFQQWLGKMSVPSYHDDRNQPGPAALGKTIEGERSLTAWQRQLEQDYGPPLLTEFSEHWDTESREQTIGQITANLNLYAYPDFGLYIYRSPSLYLAIRCGSIGQNGNGGHAHNDQLSFELTLKGKDLIRDPGTYLYTPSPEKRNLFRSTPAHFTPQYKGQEQNQWLAGAQGLFSLIHHTQAQCLYFAPDGFVGMHRGFGLPVYRLIALEPNKIRIFDYGQDLHEPGLPGFYSNGYGKLIQLSDHRSM